VADRGDLRHAADIEQRAEQRVIFLEILDRKLRRRQRLAQLIDPRLPRVLTPEIVGPHETALEHVGAQRFGFGGVEIRCADLRHHHHRALEQCLVGEPYNHVIRLLWSREADVGFGELRQADRHVDVGTRKIDAPAAAITAAVAAKRDAAELVQTVEIFGNRRTNIETAAPTAALGFAA
jgi:hypothetical protein